MTRPFLLPQNPSLCASHLPGPVGTDSADGTSSRSSHTNPYELRVHGCIVVPIWSNGASLADLALPVSERILARDPMDEIRRAFQLFDDDNTGKISLRNLRRVAKEIGDRLEDDEL